MSDKKISQLTDLPAASVSPSNDVLAIVDTNVTETKKITAKALVDGALNAGTANGLVYLNGSKEATTGSIISYDGTTFKVDDAVVINESGGDNDTRIEGDTDANLFFVDAGNNRIGIGTNTPAQKLDVDGQVVFGSTNRWGTSVATFTSQTTGQNGAGLRAAISSAANPSFYNVDDSNTGMFTPGSDVVGFSTNGLERLRLTASSAVFNEGGEDYDFRIESDTDTHAFFVRGSDGNIGVGASAPTRNLEVSRSASQASVRVTGSNNGTTTNSRTSYGSIIEVQNTDTTEGNLTGLWHLNPAGTGRGAVAFQGTGTDSTDVNLLFITGGTAAERMRITSAGELLVGGTTSLYNTFPGSISSQSTGGGYVNLLRTATTITTGSIFGGLGFWGRDTTANAATLHAYVYGTSSGTHAAGDNPTDLVFGTTPDGTETAAEAGRITQAGSYVLKGGTTTAAAGVGIIFPATQVASANANSLDDYEEGTWTPTVVGSTSAGTGTYTAQVGRYVKIGGLVTAQAYLVWSAHTGTGNLKLGGLPFTTANVTNLSSGVAIGPSNIALTANNVLTANIDVNAVTISVEQYPVGGGAVSDVPMDTAGRFLYTVTYLASA